MSVSISKCQKQADRMKSVPNSVMKRPLVSLTFFVFARPGLILCRLIHASEVASLSELATDMAEE